MSDRFKIGVESEVGRLEGVLVHRPGLEVAYMTPETAEKALYSDILNLSVVTAEYSQFVGVLEKRSRVFHVCELLREVLEDDKAREGLVRRICEAEGVPDIADGLLQMSSSDLSKVMIEGVTLVQDNLSRFLSRDRFSLPPLHNFFFTRDSAVAIGDEMFISRMANRVRGRETRIIEAIFDHGSQFATKTVNPSRLGGGGLDVTIEGGDVLVAAPNVMVLGMGGRTTCKAIDFMIERYKSLGGHQHLIVQELPSAPESFIHLDMIFTFLDQNTCMVYEPVIMKEHEFATVHIEIDNGKVVGICHEKTLLTALKKLGRDYEPLYCGGRHDRWSQEREQWHSGANFLALAPGQVIGYGRNSHTVEELDRAGYDVVSAEAVITGQADLDKLGKCIVTIDGSELARGGGGCRCMSMPLARATVA
ncbi:MAG: arginine deiminase [Candidatus Krumholzibacteriia bacterium]|jgi:arginine deiminase